MAVVVVVLFRGILSLTTRVCKMYHTQALDVCVVLLTFFSLQYLPVAIKVEMRVRGIVAESKV